MSHNLKIMRKLTFLLLLEFSSYAPKPIAQSGRKEFSGPAVGFLPGGGNYTIIGWFDQMEVFSL